MTWLPLYEIDSFATSPFTGKRVPVVLDADLLTQAEKEQYAKSSGHIETVFVSKPQNYSDADFRIEVYFQTGAEVGFIGGALISACRAWLAHGGVRHTQGKLAVEQQGLILYVDQTADDTFQYVAPRPTRNDLADDGTKAAIAVMLGIGVGDIVSAKYQRGGPSPRVAVQLKDADAVSAVTPANITMSLCVWGNYPQPGRRQATIYFKGGVDHGCAESTGWLLYADLETDPKAGAIVVEQSCQFGREVAVQATPQPDGSVLITGATFITIIAQICFNI
jgi:predicted PhzF superfamily epimerase YddE/YHI9